MQIPKIVPNVNLAIFIILIDAFHHVHLICPLIRLLLLVFLASKYYITLNVYLNVHKIPIYSKIKSLNYINAKIVKLILLIAITNNKVLKSKRFM